MVLRSMLVHDEQQSSPTLVSMQLHTGDPKVPGVLARSPTWSVNCLGEYILETWAMWCTILYKTQTSGDTLTREVLSVRLFRLFVIFH